MISVTFTKTPELCDFHIRTALIIPVETTVLCRTNVHRNLLYQLFALGTNSGMLQIKDEDARTIPKPVQDSTDTELIHTITAPQKFKPLGPFPRTTRAQRN